MTLSFEEKDLTESFGKIELFLATFPGDENIRLASIDLVACTLKAIELAISYFMSHTCKNPPLTHCLPAYTRQCTFQDAELHTVDRFRRVLPLIGDGSGFQEELINAINEIPMQCHRVKDCALESHIHGTKEAMELILSGGFFQRIDFQSAQTPLAPALTNRILCRLCRNRINRRHGQCDIRHAL